MLVLCAMAHGGCLALLFRSCKVRPVFLGLWTIAFGPTQWLVSRAGWEGDAVTASGGAFLVPSGASFAVNAGAVTIVAEAGRHLGRRRDRPDATAPGRSGLVEG